MIDPVEPRAEVDMTDEDLAWIEKQIERVENNTPVSDDAAYQKREYLGRLRRIRREMLRDGQ